MQDYTVYVYRKDKRYKNGEKLYSVNVITDTTEEIMSKLYCSGYYASPVFTKKYRVEYIPTMKQVVNLMTGKLVEIEHDTPRCCDPSSELFWSM